MEYEAVIGLEVHVQLNTNTKIFCNCSTKFGDTPNSNTCPVCLGMPGVLPVLNKEVLNKAIQASLAINCTINKYTKFDRKHYFYPDLPKAYQISQYDKPIAENGYLDINTSEGVKRIGITRLHMEEDAGKSIHPDYDKTISLIDLNRAGVPLLEIVSEPDMRTPEEAYEYLTLLKSIMRYIEVSDCNMEAGSLRCDANVSIRPKGEKKLGTKVEIKNMNSFKAVRNALQYEIERQIDTVEDGGTIVQETRLYNESTGKTFTMRSKEEAHDYRYFPEPDIPPIIIEQSTIDEIKSSLPELPIEKKQRFMSAYNLSEYDASILISEKSLANYFEQVVEIVKQPKLIANWIISEVLGYLNKEQIDIDNFPIIPKHFAELISAIADKTISQKIAKEVFADMIKSKQGANAIIEKKGLKQISDTDFIANVVKEVIEAEQDTVKKYCSGKTKVIGFLVGQVMKKTKGKANPQVVNQLLKEQLCK